MRIVLGDHPRLPGSKPKRPVGRPRGIGAPDPSYTPPEPRVLKTPARQLVYQRASEGTSDGPC